MHLSRWLLILTLVLSGAASASDDHNHGSAEPSEVQGALPGVQGDLAELDLAAYEGKVVVLTTLAGWCVGCFAEVPNFVALQNEYADRGVVVVGVMTQSAPEWTETFIERYGVSYPVFLDMSGQATTERFGPEVVPTAMMVYDRSGRLVESLSGFDAEKLRPVLEGLL